MEKKEYVSGKWRWNGIKWRCGGRTYTSTYVIRRVTLYKIRRERERERERERDRERERKKKTRRSYSTHFLCSPSEVQGNGAQNEWLEEGVDGGVDA